MCLGRIVMAHGVRGEVGIEAYTEAPGEITRYGVLTDEAGARTFEIAALRLGPKGPIVRLAGVTDRDAAEDLKGTRLYVPRGRLPGLRDKDSYYHADLIGLRAERADGTILGTVFAVQNFGAGDLLEIAPPATTQGNPPQNTLLVPFTKAVVPVVDIGGGRVVIDPPPGLLDGAGAAPEGAKGD